LEKSLRRKAGSYKCMHMRNEKTELVRVHAQELPFLLSS
jgi:hypothetical protein